jgi:hypothetical protein
MEALEQEFCQAVAKKTLPAVLLAAANKSGEYNMIKLNQVKTKFKNKCL